MYMKKSFITFIALCTILTSCKTVEKNIDFTKAPATINMVVPTAVRLSVTEEPKAAPYLGALATIIKTFALGQDLSPVALQQTIAVAKVKELQTSEAKNIEAMTLVLYKTYYSDAVAKEVATVNNLAPILSALADSINAGLAPAAQ